jgi:circadian clock protein KaiC
MIKKRIQIGINGLDDMINGGFLPGTANLIEGAPGTGKTTLAMQFIHHGIEKHNEPGLIITFEEFPRQYYHDALQFGWDFKKMESEGMLRIIFSDPHTTLDEFEKMDGKFIEIIKEMKAKRVAVDSMSHFESLAADEFELRDIEAKFINSLKREHVTSVLLKENDNLMGQVNQVTSKIPFIVDSYTLLRYVEMDSSIQKALIILKMRGSDHQKDIRLFKITHRGIEVESKFKGLEGIMSGMTRHTPQDAFVNVFGKK